MSDLKPSEIRKIQSGEMLFMEGDIGDEMFIVRSGMLRVMKREGSKMVELARLGPGQMLGEMAVLGNYPRTATVIAVELSQVAVISRSFVEESLPQLPAWIVGVLKSLTRRLKDTLELKYQADFRGALPALLHLILSSQNQHGQVALSMYQISREVNIVYGLAEKDAQKLLRILSPELWKIQGDFGRELLVVDNVKALVRWLEWLENPQLPMSDTEKEFFQGLGSRLN